MLSEVRQVPRIEHPLEARFKAIARPIPRDAPVMTATLPARSGSRWREGFLWPGDDILDAC